MARQDAPRQNPLLDAVHEGSSPQGFELVRLVTRRGPVETRLYPVPAPRAAVFVGGVGGDWDTPANALYPRLCADLPGEGVACLRLNFRDPTDLSESECDLLAAVEYFQRRHVEAVALIGHSFGGAAAIRAAARCGAVRTVVTLASQSYGAERVTELGPRCSTFFLHGLEDRTLSPNCSVHLHQAARDPKRLELIGGTGHSLEEAAERVYRELRGWIVERLRQAAPGSGIRPETTGLPPDLPPPFPRMPMGPRP